MRIERDGGAFLSEANSSSIRTPMDEEAQDSARDATAMAAWVAGDADAFDVLHSAYRDRLWRYVLRSVREEDIAHELYQDIWMRVIDRRDDWQPTGRFVGWLFAIARHRLIDHHRAEGRRPSINADIDIDTHQESSVTSLVERPLGPEERAELSQDDERVQRALDTLPDEQREAVLMHHVAGLTHAEISDATGAAREAVKSRLRYAVRRLRKLLRCEPLDVDRRGT